MLKGIGQRSLLAGRGHKCALMSEQVHYVADQQISLQTGC